MPNLRPMSPRARGTGQDEYVPIAPVLGAAIGWAAGSFWIGLGVCAVVSLLMSWREIRLRRLR